MIASKPSRQTYRAHPAYGLPHFFVRPTDDKSLEKPEAREARRQISNLRDLRQSPPDWPIERKHDYFTWAQQVAYGLRGESRALDQLLDAEFAQRPR